ncbi:Uncharacterised protein [uncultured Clostridium sp.]|uniref:DUF6147 family protein n=1 Tax=Enterocloster citroniae TaxID=358743 RepID=UPI0008229EB2|nr:Uncharacterised protein [uncultured Clostridium sp.]
MKKKNIRKIIFTSLVSALMMVFITLSAFAMPYNPNDYTSINVVSDLLAPNVKQSKATESTMTRGDFFARADLVIKNNGDGTIGALAIAFARYPIDEAYITLYLDQWDATTERWRQVNYYEAEFYASDYPEGLTTPTVDISFIDQPRGYYYRLRGVFGVVYNGAFEAFSPTTDGVLLD